VGESLCALYLRLLLVRAVVCWLITNTPFRTHQRYEVLKLGGIRYIAWNKDMSEMKMKVEVELKVKFENPYVVV
jgi:hypothetical protein